jgi:hypothetical protein
LRRHRHRGCREDRGNERYDERYRDDASKHGCYVSSTGRGRRMLQDGHSKNVGEPSSVTLFPSVHHLWINIRTCAPPVEDAGRGGGPPSNRGSNGGITG